MLNFKTVSWANSTNIYEVNIRQYSPEGTLNAFARSLPRLKAMGVETLWFMPLQPIGLLNRKGTMGSYYSISDHTAINPEFGTKEDFKMLVEEAHRLGFKVIIDWVANHTSWDHVWTKTDPSFYTKDHNGNFMPPYPEWDDVIHLNYDNEKLWAAMIIAMNYWLKEFNIDGFRCDMAHLVRLEFWEVARAQLDSVKPLFWLAETENISYHMVFDASYTWEWMHKTEDFIKGHTNIEGLFDQLVRYNTDFPPEAIRLYFTSNHDENSHTGTEFDKYGDAYKVMAVFSCTWNGIPLLYSGQELPNRKRLLFFEKDMIEWKDNCELESFYKTLLELHSHHPALRAVDESVSTYKMHTADHADVLAYMRKKEDKQVLVILNLSGRELDAEIYSEFIEGTYTDVFSGNAIQLSQRLHLNIAAFGFYVYQK